MNIYTKFTLLCVFLVASSCISLIIVVSYQLSDQISDAVLINTKRRFSETINSIEDFIANRTNEVLLGAKILEHIELKAGNANLKNKLKEFESINNAFYGFSVFDHSGIKISESKSVLNTNNQDIQKYLENLAFDKPTTIQLVSLKSTGEIVVNVISIILGKDKIKGYLIGHVLINDVYKSTTIFIEAYGADKVKTILFDNYGNDLYSNGSFTEKFKNNIFSLVSQIDLNGNKPGPVMNDERLLFVSYLEAPLLNEEKLILTVQVEKFELLEVITYLQSKIIYTAIIVFLFTIIIALITVYFFLRPILRLEASVSEMAKGKLDTEIVVHSNDVIGRLAQKIKLGAMTLMEEFEKEKSLKKELLDQKDILQNANRQITESIQYSRRIQNNMLPTEIDLKKYIKESFIIYHPKDVVSGDFYWFEKVRKGRNDYLIIAAADCTGHGVPGAIMSMIGSNQLTNIVYYQNSIEPVKILARVDKGIKFELHKNGVDTEYIDGMELMLCVIDLDTYEINFAGAGIPLILISNNELEVYRSPKLMIGGVEGYDEKEVEAHFRQSKIQLKKGDSIYLATDGFQDQFGGVYNKKLMRKNFRNFLIEANQLTMRDQKKYLEKKFLDWKGNELQTDDMMVIGFKV